MSDDESTIYSPPLFTPPPMAPLPPPPPFSRTAVTSSTNGLQREMSLSSFSNDPVSDGQRAYKYAGGVIPDSIETYSCISYQRLVEPIIQSGPQCGLVALAMADSILNKDVTVDQISETSVTKGYSKQGEIFSSHDMESLSAQTFGCKTSVLDIRDVGGKWEFLNCLARGDLLLVPYDPDKNYVPVLKKGHKAHWALVTGFFAAVSDKDMLQRFQRGNIKQDSNIVNLYHIETAPLPPNTPKILPVEPNATPRALSANVPVRPPNPNPVGTKRGVSARTLPPEPTSALTHPLPHESTKLSHDIGDLPQQENIGKNALASAVNLSRNPLELASYILVYAKQGKSKYTGIWNAKTLVESCCNLIEVDPERLQGGDNSMVFPEKGIAEVLCGKVVVLHMKN